MKAIFGKKRFKTAMVIIAAMVVITIENVGASPIPVRAEEQYAMKATNTAGTSSAFDFSTAEVNYTGVTEQTVKIENTGSEALTITIPTDDSYMFGSLTPEGAIASGGSATFTIKPRTGLSAGTYNKTFTIQGAGNGGSGNASANITVSFEVTTAIEPSISFDKTSPATIAVREEYELTASIYPAGTKVKAYTWHSEDTDVATVSHSNNVATITGKKAGTGVDITVTATLEGSNKPITGTFTVNVLAEKTLIDKTTLPDAYVGGEYKAQLTAKSVANDTYEWKHIGGTFPPGLQLNPDTGLISGTPTKNGTYQFTIQAKSKKNNTVDTEVFTIKVTNDIVIFTSTTDGNVTPQRPVNIDSIAQVRANEYKSFFGGTNYLLHFPVSVKQSGDSISGKSKVETAINAVKSKVEVHYVDVSPSEEVQLSGQTTKTKPDITDMGAVVSMPFTITPADPYCVVLRYHNGELYPMARLTSSQLNPTVEGYYYNGKGQLYIYSRYFSTFAIVRSDENIITIGFNSNGGSHVDPVVITAGGTISEPTKPTRNGYTFEGWYMDENLRTKWTTGTTFNSDWILNANWTQQNSGATNSGNSGSTGGSNSGGGTTNRGNNPSGTTPVNAPQTGDPIDYVRAFAALIVICAGTLVLLYTLKARRRK